MSQEDVALYELRIKLLKQSRDEWKQLCGQSIVLDFFLLGLCLLILLTR